MELRNEGKLWIASDQIPLFYRCYPGHKSDYYLTIIHGYAEHSGRYTKLIECIQRMGRTVIAYDLRGHGRSGGERGGIDAWAQYWDDFRGLSAHVQMQGQVAARKTIILGHSLGGLIALEGALRDGKGIGGLVLSSPCLGVRLSSGLMLLNRMLARFFPKFSYANPVKPEDLSCDAEVCQSYVDDPLILKSICSKTLQLMVQAGDSLGKSERPLSMPLWLLAAGNERVVDLNRTLSVYAKLEAPFKKLRIFEEFRHEIFNEVGSEIAYDTALQAIEQIVEFDSRSDKRIS